MGTALSSDSMVQLYFVVPLNKSYTVRLLAPVFYLKFSMQFLNESSQV